jgi:small multidrug resistance pump
MSRATLAVLVTVAFSAIGVLGDYFLKLATISALYSVSMVLLLTAIGVGIFREPIGGWEALGILMAIASLVLLARFA